MKAAICGLVLVAQVAHAGLAKYSAFVVADAVANAPAPRNSIRVTYLGANGFNLKRAITFCWSTLISRESGSGQPH